MRVFQIASLLPAPGFETVNRYVLSLIRNLKSQGCTVVNIVRPVPFIFFSSFFKTSKWSKYSLLISKRSYEVELNKVSVFPYFSVGSVSFLHSILSASILFFNFKKIKKEVLHTKPELVHAHYIFPDGLLAYYIFKKYKIPYIITLQTEQRFLKGFFVKVISSIILKNSSHIISIHPHLKELLIPYTNKVTVLPLGINDLFFIKGFIRARTNKIKLVTVGYFQPIKNYPSAISVVAELKKQFDVEYTIVGYGPEEDKIKNLINEFDLSKNVTIIKNIDNNDLPEILLNSDIFLLPSFKETFGLVYIEAMALGLPVILSKNTGVYHYLPTELKELGFDANDIDGMVNKIIELYKDRSFYEMVSNSSLEFSQNFKWSDIAKEHINIYQRVMALNHE